MGIKGSERFLCCNCVLPSTFPGISFNDKGDCNHCQRYKGKETTTAKRRKFEEKFLQLIAAQKQERDYDVIVLMASDWRIELIERILGREVIAIEIGQSPIREDVVVDLGELERLLDDVTSQVVAKPRSGRVSSALKGAAVRAGRWTPSKRS